MPRLPSGKHVGISSDRLVTWAEGVDFNMAMEFTMNIRTMDKMLHFIDLVYYQDTDVDVPEHAQPDNDYLPGLKLSDVATDRCDWCAEDKAWFAEWLTSPLVLEWFEVLQADLHEILSARPIPDVLDDHIEH